MSCGLNMWNGQPQILHGSKLYCCWCMIGPGNLWPVRCCCCLQPPSPLITGHAVWADGIWFPNKTWRTTGPSCLVYDLRMVLTGDVGLQSCVFTWGLSSIELNGTYFCVDCAAKTFHYMDSPYEERLFSTNHRLTSKVVLKTWDLWAARRLQSLGLSPKCIHLHD